MDAETRGVFSDEVLAEAKAKAAAADARWEITDEALIGFVRAAEGKVPRHLVERIAVAARDLLRAQVEGVRP